MAPDDDEGADQDDDNVRIYSMSSACNFLRVCGTCQCDGVLTLVDRSRCFVLCIVQCSAAL